MANATDNDVTANAAIVALYPEIAGIPATMDALAVLGRKVFTVILDDCDHGPALEDSLNTTLSGQGYKVIRKQDRVTVSFP